MDQMFYWGCSTSSHQVEGNNSNNDWWVWEQQGKLKEPSGLACDHYNRFAEDIGIMSELGHNAGRMSLEWSRLEPENGRWNEEAFDHYDKVFDEFHRRGIEPFVTLHHFTNPIWFDKEGGWLSPKSVSYFARFVRKVAQRYSRKIKFWITINEPMVFLYFGYLTGEWPPGIKSYDAAFKVLYQLIQAHVHAYDAIHEEYAKQSRSVWVSLAKHVTSFAPCREFSIMDRLSAGMRHWFVNEMMASAFTTGFLFYPALFCEFLPKRKTIDFIGINYYTRDFVSFGGFAREGILGNVCDKKHHSDKTQEFNAMGWEVYPQGFYELLVGMKKFQLPIYVLENGICAKEDEQRCRFISQHVKALLDAKAKGADIRGYFYWSLLDNFEWAHGFSPRFGVVEVEYKTQQRKIRKSAQILTDECRKIS